MENNRTQKQIVGQIGENAASEYLKSKGYVILDRNYRKKWGELDIVSEKDDKIHFVEVKSVSRNLDQNVSRESDYRAEDNMHPWKLERLKRAIQTYLLDKQINEETDWQFDVATVYVDHTKKICKVSLLEDIVL